MLRTPVSLMNSEIPLHNTDYIYYRNLCYIKVLGVKHSCKIKLMQQIVGNCPTNHLAVGI